MHFLRSKSTKFLIWFSMQLSLSNAPCRILMRIVHYKTFYMTVLHGMSCSPWNFPCTIIIFILTDSLCDVMFGLQKLLLFDWIKSFEQKHLEYLIHKNKVEIFQVYRIEVLHYVLVEWSNTVSYTSWRSTFILETLWSTIVACNAYYWKMKDDNVESTSFI